MIILTADWVYGYIEFGVQGIHVEDGVDFLIRRLGLESYSLSK